MTLIPDPAQRIDFVLARHLELPEDERVTFELRPLTQREFTALSKKKDLDMGDLVRRCATWRGAAPEFRKELVDDMLPGDVKKVAEKIMDISELGADDAGNS